MKAEKITELPTYEMTLRRDLEKLLEEAKAAGHLTGTLILLCYRDRDGKLGTSHQVFFEEQITMVGALHLLLNRLSNRADCDWMAGLARGENPEP